MLRVKKENIKIWIFHVTIVKIIFPVPKIITIVIFALLYYVKKKNVNKTIINKISKKFKSDVIDKIL